MVCRNSYVSYIIDTSLCESSFFFSFSSPILLRFYLIVAFTCDRFAHLSTSRGIKIGCHYSLTQFFFNLPRSSRYASYLLIHVCMCIYTFTNVRNHFAHEQFRRPVQFLRRVFAAFSPSRLHPPARPKWIRSSARKGFPGIHANFNLFGYASRPLPR